MMQNGVLRQRSLSEILANIVVFAALFLSYLALTHLFSGYRLIDGWDTVFDSDPARFIDRIANGWAPRHIAHPQLDNLFSPVIVAITEVSYQIGLIENKQEFKHCLALAVVPAFSSLKVILIFYLVRALGATNLHAALFAALFAISWTQVVFAAVPDSFSLSSTIIVATLYYAVLVLTCTVQDRPFVWGALGFLLIGITLTNIAIFGLILWAVRYYQTETGIWPSFLDAAKITLAATLLTVALATLAVMALGDEVGHFLVGESLGYSKYTTFDRFWSELGGFPVHFWLTVIGFSAEQISNASNINAGHPILIQFSYEAFERSLAGIVLSLSAVLLTLFTCRNFKSRPVIEKLLLSASISILVFNAIFHSLFGLETFLFTPHWQPAVFILLYFILENLFPAKDHKLTGCLLLSALLLAWVNTMTIHELLLTVSPFL